MRQIKKADIQREPLLIRELIDILLIDLQPQYSQKIPRTTCICKQLYGKTLGQVIKRAISESE